MLSLATIKNAFGCCLAILLCLLIVYVPGAAAQGLSQDQINALDEGALYYDVSGDSTCTSSSGSLGGTLDAFLQAIALHESGGDPTAGSPGGASGKYQVEPDTWQSWTQTFYPPAAQYSYAGAAPEDMQDAVAYLVNVPLYKQFNGNIFWLAIEWYSPQAVSEANGNENAPNLNQVPPGGNTETFANFGDQIQQAVSTGTMQAYPGSDVSGPIDQISLNYTSAPDFQTYLTKDGGAPSEVTYSASSSSSSSSSCSSSSSSCTLSNGMAVSGPNAAILCEAEKYAGIYYLYGGGHDGYAAFRAACPEASISAAAAASTEADPGPCATDCSGLVSVAVDGAYNQTFDWIVSPSSGQMVSQTDSGQNVWKSIPISEAEAGDIVTTNNGEGNGTPDGHVEIVEYVSGNTVYTFGSHYTGTQTGSTHGPASYWNDGAWRYTGPGSSSSS